jgi:integrase
MRGLGGIYKRGRTWWVRYYHRGREYRESSHSTERADATRLLRLRLTGLQQGNLPGTAEERLTFEEMAADYLQERELKGAPPGGLLWSKARVAKLRRTFVGIRAVDITTTRMREYAQARRAAGASASTVNRDLGVLSRMFTLAIQAGRLSRRPYFPRLREAPPRQGFMEHPEYLAIRAQLPPDLQDVLDFGYLSGWRRSEVLTLEWQDVDRAAGVIRLRPERSKTREGRLLVLSGPLRELIERRWRLRFLGCPFVFQRGGHWLRETLAKNWRPACRKARLPGKLFHDLRRTAIRNMVRAGIPERVAMQISGHKTRSIFDRYNIVSEGDLRQAAERLAAFIQAANA